MQRFHRSLISNFFSLGILRATDAIVLVVIIPVIVGRIGIANYGIIALVQVILNYGKAVIDYGFTISGVRQIALAGKSNRLLDRVFNDILYTRVFICIGITAILLLAVETIPYLNTNAAVFQWGIFLWIGHVVFTDWFFLGLKQAKYIARANLLAKVLYGTSVVIFIHQPSDLKYVLAFQGVTALITGIFVLIFIHLNYNIQLRSPSWSPIKNYLYDDFRILLTHLASEFNTSYSILILNILTNNTMTGYFGVMQKVVQAFRFLIGNFSQTIFPVVCEKTQEGWAEVKRFIRTTFSVFFIFPLIGILLIALFARPVLEYFTGPIPNEIVFFFRIFLLVPVVILFKIPSYQILLAYERKPDYSQIYLISIVLTLFLAYFLTRQSGLMGLVLSVLLVELLVTVGLYLKVWINYKKWE